MTKDKAKKAPAKVNRAGRARSDYTGGKSTLCFGCGHDSISNHIVTAFFQAGVQPYDIVKMSGIGCSSKTPGYFINKASGFNSIHGRMAPVSTGTYVANRNLHVVGVSGDGDTASIGVGGFVHLIRRNLPMVYIVMNNGVYGLTKGQFSATADQGSTMKWGEVNPFETLDLCTMALDLGCSFVARAFSGDAKQIVPMLKAAIHHPGTAVIDILSPCVTFANHDGSSKSYDYLRSHKIALHELGVIEEFEESRVDYPEGESETVAMPDGTKLVLRKLDSRQHDIHDRTSAMKSIYDSRQKGEVLTGIFYVDPKCKSFAEISELTETPLAQLGQKELQPSAETLAEIMSEYK